MLVLKVAVALPLFLISVLSTGQSAVLPVAARGGTEIYRGQVSVGPETAFVPEVMLRGPISVVVGWLVHGNGELRRAMVGADRAANMSASYGRTYKIEFRGVHRKLDVPISGFDDEVRVLKVLRIKRCRTDRCSE